MDGVRCPSSSVCWATGVDQSTDNTLVVESNDGGRSWNQETTVAESTIKPFAIGHAIACPSVSQCTIVGSKRVTNGLANAVEMTTNDGGLTWQTVTMGVSSGTQVMTVASLACPSTTECVSVGFAEVPSSTGGFGTVPLAWNTTDGGATWNQTNPPGLAANDSLLTGISCPTTSTCFADGFNVTALNSTTGVPVGATVVETTDGGITWAQQTIASPQDQLLALLTATCQSATSCEAGGALFTNTSSLTNYQWATAVLTPGQSCVSTVPAGPTSVAPGVQFPSSISGSISATTSGTSLVLSGITPDIPYHVSVTATNAAGTGCASYESHDVMNTPMELGSAIALTTNSTVPAPACQNGSSSSTGTGGSTPENLSLCDLPDPDAVIDPSASPAAMDVFTSNSTSKAFGPGENIPWFQYTESGNSWVRRATVR